MNWFSPPMPTEVSYEDIVAESDRFRQWDFRAGGFSETGYEDVLDDLKSYTDVMYEKASAAGKKELIAEVLAIYREVDVFPITYFSDAGVVDEIGKCLNFNAQFVGNTVSTGAGVGTTLCNWLFPNLFDAASKQDVTTEKEGAESLIGKFKSDKFLSRAIQFCFSYKGGRPVPTAVMGGLRLVGSSPTNFRPANASAIIKRFIPDGGTYYDFSCGFGGRLLGTLMSGDNYRYVGTDPNHETMYNLHRLGESIEMVTGRSDSYELHCVGSEEFRGPENSVDFSFSSPPYFDLEIYGDDEGQSINKYPQLDGWLEGFVRGTVKNLQHMLKPGAFYCVNIADFTSKGENVNFVDAWADISAQEGLPQVDTLYLGVTARSGSKQLKAGEQKKENILVFQNQK